MNKRTLKTLGVISFFLLYGLSFLYAGFALGLVYEQLIIAKSLGYIDTNIEINFNGTQFAEDLNKTFIPAWKEEFNLTLQKEFREAEGK